MADRQPIQLIQIKLPLRDKTIHQLSDWNLAKHYGWTFTCPGCGSVSSVNRPVRPRLIGGVGLAEKNPRLPDWVAT
jgi:hypothetical protein